MRSLNGKSLGSFLGAAAAVTLVAAAARFCPGGCTACGSCVSSVGPALGGLLATGAAIGGSAWLEARGGAAERERCEE